MVGQQIAHVTEMKSCAHMFANGSELKIIKFQLNAICTALEQAYAPRTGTVLLDQEALRNLHVLQAVPITKIVSYLFLYHALAHMNFMCSGDATLYLLRVVCTNKDASV